jgi:putative colanic acid biosynthesis acetyltransferase WcaF
MSKPRHLSEFHAGQSRMLLKLRVFCWFIIQHLFFKSYLAPNRFRVLLLRFFGASIGRKVLIRRGIRIHFPWKLIVGNDCWIGEEVWFINHEKVVIGNNVCISQRAIICSGGHDYRSVSLAYQHAPITIGDGAWVCLDAKVLPGTRIGKGSVISAGEIARGDIPDFHMLIDGKLKTIDPPSLP